VNKQYIFITFVELSPLFLGVSHITDTSHIETITLSFCLLVLFFIIGGNESFSFVCSFKGVPNDFSFEFWEDRTTSDRFLHSVSGTGFGELRAYFGHFGLGHPKKGIFDTIRNVAEAGIEPAMFRLADRHSFTEPLQRLWNVEQSKMRSERVFCDKGLNSTF